LNEDASAKAQILLHLDSAREEMGKKLFYMDHEKYKLIDITDAERFTPVKTTEEVTISAGDYSTLLETANMREETFDYCLELAMAMGVRLLDEATKDEQKTL